MAELGHQLAMHVVAMKPPYVSRTEGVEAADFWGGGGVVIQKSVARLLD